MRKDTFVFFGAGLADRVLKEGEGGGGWLDERVKLKSSEVARN